MERTLINNLLSTLGFTPQEGAKGIFQKKYAQHRNYVIAVNCNAQSIDYGNKIKCGSKRTSNFSKDENFVVLECVDRLLTKGYKPENIELEKIWRAGHGHSGELDICVYHDGGERKEYLLIECKTFGAEFDKELTNMREDGGQLFTYFKFSNSADLLMLYASRLSDGKIVYRNEIVKIEEEYRQGDVADSYEKWNKLTQDNGIFEDEREPYLYKNKALKHDDLKEIRLEDSNFIFIQFLEILRHNVVSDKPNAFNKIFTLFLCKIYDEKMREGTGDDLHFQWRDDDDHVEFQLRLTELYKNGMKEFLEKKVSDFSKDEFEKNCQKLDKSARDALLRQINVIRLEKNNEFAIKEVFDKRSFDENAVVVKAIVKLLEKYKIRYCQRQQYLSDFFELLLTTGLKQEVGQFFTPVPIAQFIIKSLPIDKIVTEKLHKGQQGNLLPYIMDFAAGSGHFLTESMHLIQGLINQTKTSDLKADIKKKIEAWRQDPFDWAFTYIYGVEKDYRLVKVGKVGCYLHGDGLANVIHSDGLAKFGHEDYKDKLASKDEHFPLENKQFDVVISNPPYSVSTFKNAAKRYYGKEDFELYGHLTDSSSEIECIFIERTKQLLKDGGVAGIILPSSILSNAGIYAKAREMILRYFEIIAVTELGSGTFMETGTNTVILFLRRRNNYICERLEYAVDKFFKDFQDVTMNGIETPVAGYVNYVWSGIKWDDYLSLLQRKPNKSVQKHELYKEYETKIKAKDETDFLDQVLATEKEKILYFILAYPQQVVIVKSGDKEAEKRFLGYEFSKRWGHEGIHPVQRGKMIDECTQLFDADLTTFENPEKAGTYIHRAFVDPNVELKVPENLKNHVFKMDLVDMMTFDWATFEKKISLAIKKKVKSKWTFVSFGNVISTLESGSRPPGGVKFISRGAYSLGGEHIDNHNGRLNLTNPRFVPMKFYNDAVRGKLQTGDFLICKDGALTGKVALVHDELAGLDAMINEHLFLVRCESITTQKYLFYFFFSENGQDLLKSRITGAAQGGLNSTELKSIKIPLPPLDVQTKVVKEIEKIEQEENEVKKGIIDLQKRIASIVDTVFAGNFETKSLSNVTEIRNGGTPKSSVSAYWDNGTICWATLVDTKKKYLTGTVRKITQAGLDSSNAQLLPINTVLFSSRATIGDITIAKVETATNQGYKNFICDESVLEYEFLYYVLRHETKNIEQLAGGMTYPEISKSAIGNYKIPVPPLSEQKKIVARIEKLETEIAALQKEAEAFSERKSAVLRKWL